MRSEIRFLKPLFLITFLFLYQMLNAQILYQPRNILEAIDMVNAREKSPKANNDYEGSPYMYDEFKEGLIYYDDKYSYNDVPLRYNIYTDEIEFDYKEKNLIYAFFPRPKINRVIIKEDTFVVAMYEDGNTVKPGFFIARSSGNINLLVKPEVEFTEAQPETPFLMAQPAKYHRTSDKYYLQKSGENAVLVKKTKDILKILEDHHKAISAYIKQEHISAKNEEDLQQLVKYYNSL